MSPADMSLVATEVQAILELAMFRLAAKEPLEADDAFTVEVALSVASGLLNPVHDAAVADASDADLIQAQAPGAIQ